MAFNSRLNAWKKQLADSAIDAAVARTEAGEAPAAAGEQAKKCVDLAIETGARANDEVFVPSDGK